MPYTPILATLGYIFSPCGGQVLMVHRTARSGDAHLGKWNGLGGKIDPGEDVVSGFRREVREEAGLECDELELAGTVSWPGFGTGGEDWFGFLFRVTKFTGTPPPRNGEGELAWQDVAVVPTLPLWDGDRHFLPLVLTRQAGQFHGVMPYHGGKPVGWSFSVLPGSPRSPAVVC